MPGRQAGLGAVVREGEFGKQEAEDESGQLKRLWIPGTTAFLEVGLSQHPLLILDPEDSCQQVAPNCS